MARDIDFLTKRSEYREQIAIFEWALYNEKRFPELELMTGSLNGVRLTIGQAVKAKAAGLKKGFPDITLPVARCGYHSLMIELKPRFRGRKKLVKPKADPDQHRILLRLSEEKNYCAVCRGSEAAIGIITQYLKGEL